MQRRDKGAEKKKHGKAGGEVDEEGVERRAAVEQDCCGRAAQTASRTWNACKRFPSADSISGLARKTCAGNWRCPFEGRLSLCFLRLTL